MDHGFMRHEEIGQGRACCQDRSEVSSQPGNVEGTRTAMESQAAPNVTRLGAA